ALLRGLGEEGRAEHAEELAADAVREDDGVGTRGYGRGVEQLGAALHGSAGHEGWIEIKRLSTAAIYPHLADVAFFGDHAYVGRDAVRLRFVQHAVRVGHQRESAAARDAEVRDVFDARIAARAVLGARFQFQSQRLHLFQRDVFERGIEREEIE